MDTTMSHERLVGAVECEDHGDYISFTVDGQDMHARFEPKADAVTVWGYWPRTLTGGSDISLAKQMSNRINTGEITPRVSMHTRSDEGVNLLCDAAVSTAAGISDEQLAEFLTSTGEAVAVACSYFESTYRAATEEVSR